MITITEDLLIEKGYRKFNPTFEGSSVLANFQKKVYDGSNTAYFINIKKCIGFNYDDPTSFTWWPEIQFEVNVPNKGHHSISIELVQWLNNSGKHSKITIDEIEDFCNYLFYTLDGKFYESYTIEDRTKDWGIIYYDWIFKNIEDRPYLIERIPFRIALNKLKEKDLLSEADKFLDLFESRQYDLIAQLLK